MLYVMSIPPPDNNKRISADIIQKWLTQWYINWKKIEWISNSLVSLRIELEKTR